MLFAQGRSSRPEVFYEKGVLRNFVKFTGKHLCQSLSFNKTGRPQAWNGILDWNGLKSKPIKYEAILVQTLKDWLVLQMVLVLQIRTVRSSRPELFCEKRVLRNFSKFTGKHLCQSLFFNKVAGLRPEACNFI